MFINTKLIKNNVCSYPIYFIPSFCFLLHCIHIYLYHLIYNCYFRINTQLSIYHLKYVLTNFYIYSSTLTKYYVDNTKLNFFQNLLLFPSFWNQNYSTNLWRRKTNILWRFFSILSNTLGINNGSMSGYLSGSECRKLFKYVDDCKTN